MTTLSYTIPAVSCGHCKMTIERAVSELPGVDSVNVDPDTRRATFVFGPPATEAGIKALLAEIGYPPQS